MHNEMRRKRQLLSSDETIAILGSATSGVLAVQGDEEYPYAVPLSFAYDEGKLYFHSAKAGHKLDALAHNDRVSFCVIADDDVVQPTFTTHFRSVVVFGRVRTLTADAEKRHALTCLAKKYSPDYLDEAEAEIEHDWKKVAVLELVIEQMTGKAAIEIIKARARESGAAD